MRWRLGRARVDSALESAAGHRLLDETERSALAGKPLVLHARPFPLDTNAYLKAAAGPPAWSARLARIQRLLEELESQVETAWRQRLRNPSISLQDSSADWRRFLERLDLAPLNDLIDKHNAYYPVEAGLRMEWPSGRFIVPPGILFPMPQVTVEALFRSIPERTRSEPISL